MKTIKELLKAVKPSDKITFCFKQKKPIEKLTDQDKKHTRIIAILNLAHDQETINYILNHSFTESFKYDKEKGELIYEIRFIKERSKYRGDC